MPRPDATSEAIVRAAMTEMLKTGPAGLKTAAVCTLADTNPRMIYHHFGSRGRLVHTVLTGLCMRVSSALDSSPVDSSVEEEDPIVLAVRRKLVLTEVRFDRLDLVVGSAPLDLAARVILAEYLRHAQSPPSRGLWATWRGLCWSQSEKPRLRRSAVSQPSLESGDET